MAIKPQFADEQSEEGEFQRQDDAFRDPISDGGVYPAVGGRYHLYVCLACPWASRTVIVRHLLGLEEVISMTVVDPIRDNLGWAFRDGPDYSRDPINGFSYLTEAYRASDPTFAGRVTVPVLWDKQTHRIVNNSEDDICRMFNDSFAKLGHGRLDLFPKEIETEHAQLASNIYEQVNNGVYKAGFATCQKGYETACRALFAALDELELRLGPQPLSVRKPDRRGGLAALLHTRAL